ncbi:MAG TPA: alanine racemase [Gemmatimonadaceae bacterium]|nr:alanine racemase [Gemmatimonadaceae bacterium]
MTRKATPASSLARRAWVEVDLGALRRNALAIAARAGVPILPMVKADGYGLGAVRVARALDREDPWGFGVATVTEGEELRRAGITRPIIVFTPMLAEDLDAAERTNLIPALATAATIKRWTPTRMPWHLDVDTGMSRAGLRWDEIQPLQDLIGACPPDGVFTHYHSAQLNDGSMEIQTKRFEQALAQLATRPKWIHAENSPAIERCGRSRWSFARPGVFLYGVNSMDPTELRAEPVAALRARIVEMRSVREGETVGYDGAWTATGRARIATVPVGYADGYRRALSNKGVALLRGKRVPVAGNVTMDMTMFDVTGVPCEIGDVVTMIGSDGDDAVTVTELARLGGISPYEVLTSLRSRLPRHYTTSAGR